MSRDAQVSVCGLRVISSGYNPDLPDWHTALGSAFEGEYNEDCLVFYRMPDDAPRAHQDASTKRLFFYFLFVVPNDGLRSNGQQIESEISRVGWAFLSWHMVNFDYDEPAGKQANCPVLATCEYDIPAGWPQCAILDDYTLFLKGLPIKGSVLRDETIRRIKLDPANQNLPDYRKKRLRPLYSKNASRDWMPRDGDNLLFLECIEHGDLSEGVLRRTTGDDMITAIPIERQARASLPKGVILKVLDNKNDMPRARYALLQLHDEPTPNPAETKLIHVDGKNLTVRRATFPMSLVNRTDEVDGDQSQLSYISAWIFEKRGQGEERTKAPSESIFGNLRRNGMIWLGA